MWADIFTYYRSKKTNKFCAFKSRNDILYLIYPSKTQLNQKYQKSLIVYDIINDQIINEIKELSYDDIKHYLDILNKRDLILTSQALNTLQVWDFKNWYCLISIKNNSNTACILNDKNENFIVISSMNWSNDSSDFIKIYDIKGNFIKNINESKLAVINVNSYYDIKLKKNFIVTCCRGFVKSFDYNGNKFYNKYYEEGDEENDGKLYIDFVIRNNNEITEIICSNICGKIMIWNFHNAQFINKIRIKTKEIYGIFLWKNEYLFAGCRKNENNLISLIDLKDNKYIELQGHNKTPYSVSLLSHQKYGDILISGGVEDIIIWEYLDSKFEIKKQINTPPKINIICSHKRHPSH